MNKTKAIKKPLLVAGVALLGLTSCKKDYICTCVEKATTPAHEFNGESIPEITNTTITKDFKETTKTDAESWCESKAGVEVDDQAVAFGIPETTKTTTCNLDE